MAHCKQSDIRDWREENDNYLTDRSMSSQILHQQARQQYYSSDKFAIGYSELQCRWRSQLPPTPSPGPVQDIPSSQPHLTFPMPQDSRRRSFYLPLHSPFSTQTSSSTTSTLSTPSSLLSSSCSEVSPNIPFEEHFPLLDNGCFGGEGMGEGGVECEDQECQQPTRLLGMIREVIQDALTHAHLRRRRLHEEQPTPHEQVAILQSELEAYRVLSRAKKEAADLLKHELMAVLYERVSVQQEQEHMRRQLQREISSLEYQLHLQKTTAHHHLTHLSLELHRALTDKRLLQRQLQPHSRHPPSDEGPVGVMDTTASAKRCHSRRRSC